MARILHPAKIVPCPGPDLAGCRNRSTLFGVAGSVDVAGASTVDVAGAIVEPAVDVAGASTVDLAGAIVEVTVDVAGAIVEVTVDVAGAIVEVTVDVAGADAGGRFKKKDHEGTNGEPMGNGRCQNKRPQQTTERKKDAMTNTTALAAARCQFSSTGGGFRSARNRSDVTLSRRAPVRPVDATGLPGGRCAEVCDPWQRSAKQDWELEAANY